MRVPRHHKLTQLAHVRRRCGEKILILQALVYIFVHAACVYAAHIYVDVAAQHQALIDAICVQNRWIIAFLRRCGSTAGTKMPFPPTVGSDLSPQAVPLQRVAGATPGKTNWGIVIFVGLTILRWLLA